MPKTQSKTCELFKRSVNMSPREIRAWARNPISKEASFDETRRRLPQVATLKGKPCGTWTPSDLKLAKRVLSFNARMSGMADVHGCTRKINVALRNWGRKHPRCPVPR